MAGIKISALPAAPSAQMTDVFPVDQLPGPVTYKESNAQLFTLFQSEGLALTKTNDTNVTLTLGGSPGIALLNATSLTLGWTGTLSPTRGGTGVNNGSNTLTLAGTLATVGAFASSFTMTGATAVTFPTSGTLATTSQLPTPAALTKTDDTNVTLTLGGTPATALLQATSLTLGWTGTLSGTRGGTGVNNGASTITLGGSLTTSGAFASTFTMTGITSVTFPTSGTLATVGGSVVSLQGTANEVLVNGTSGSPVSGTAITLTTPQAIGTANTPTFANLILTGAAIQFTGGLTMLGFSNVSTPVNYVEIGNAATTFGPTIFSTGSDTNIPLNLQTAGTGPMNFTSGAASSQFNFISGTANNFMTFPTSGSQTYTWQSSSGTVAFTSQIPAGSPSALTKTDDTNVTLTLGGTPSTALLQATSLTLGWTGTLAAARGGTGVGSLGSGVQTAFGLTVVGAGGMALATTGTWTPVLTSSGGGTFTTSFLNATYTIIGNRIIWDLIMNISGLGSAGTLTITGIPQGAVNFSPAPFYLTNAQVTAAVVPMAYVQGSTINLYKYTTGSAAPLTTGDIQAGTQIILSGVC